MANEAEAIKATLGIGKRSWRGRILIGIAVVAVAALGAYFWVIGGNPETSVRYTTAPVERGGFDVIVTATGTTEPTNLVEISSELSGTLDTVLVDFNDPVEEGTVLAQLDTTQLEAQLAVSRAQLDAAIARVARARATLEDAREKYEIARDLDRRGSTPHQTYVTAKANYSRARADLQTADADQSLAEANLDLQEAILEKACICSPIEGIVLDRSVDPGQIVAAALSAPVLFTIAEDLRQMELRVDIDEADIGRVRVGNTARFTVDAYDDQVFPAEIAEIRFAPQTIEGVVTYQAILTIDNSELLLRPGMTATADIVVATVTDSLVVPNAALRYAPPPETDAEGEEERSGLLGMLIPGRPEDGPESNASTVWRLTEGAPEEIAVETGETNGRMTEILGGGLAERDMLVTDRQDG
ncbi:MAG: efflux RND transporter periplasmic adaptor subunit [Paracoccaceae bacterium]|nr:efflux RND transporter periplasmic adaptor subunit [Paracoccaceae bacterium]